MRTKKTIEEMERFNYKDVNNKPSLIYKNGKKKHLRHSPRIMYNIALDKFVKP